MSLQIKKLEKPKLSQVKMNCDIPIDKKLEKFEAIKTAFSRYNFTILCGLMGQGKTSTMISLMKHVFPGCFHDVFIIIPQASLNSISPKDNIFENEPDINNDEHLYHEYNVEVLEKIYDKLTENAEDGYNSILIIDDFGGEFRTNKEAEKILNKIIIKMRHLKTSIFLLAQNIYQLPPRWRQIATNLLCFNLGKQQMEKVFDEFFSYNKTQFQQIMKLYENPHDYLLLNLKYKRLFYKFDEVVFSD